LHFLTQAGYGQAQPESHEPPLLFDLGRDPSEKVNVAAQHADVVEKIRAAVAEHRRTLVPGKPQL
jgi:hypothetical protein